MVHDPSLVTDPRFEQRSRKDGFAAWAGAAPRKAATRTAVDAAMVEPDHVRVRMILPFAKPAASLTTLDLMRRRRCSILVWVTSHRPRPTTGTQAVP